MFSFCVLEVIVVEAMDTRFSLSDDGFLTSDFVGIGTPVVISATPSVEVSVSSSFSLVLCL